MSEKYVKSEMVLHESFMKKALDLALNGKYYTSPNPMVGCIVVKDKKIISQGYHRAYGEPHAEANALKPKYIDFSGADLYVTLEPCLHYGKTPSCTSKIISSGIKRVFIATLDPNPKMNGKSVEILKYAGIEVYTGILEKEARFINRHFFKAMEKSMPWLIYKCAMTLDGKTADHNFKSKYISSVKSRKYVHELRAECDAIIVGYRTAIFDDPLLNIRLKGVQKKVNRVIIDPKAALPKDLMVFNTPNEGHTILVIQKGFRNKVTDQIESQGVEVLEVEEKNFYVDLMKELFKKNLIKILLEGGGSLACHMLKNRLIDELNFFIAPKILGGKNSPTPFSGAGFEIDQNTVVLDSLKTKKIGTDILITSLVKYN
ncbi:riboflavin biosynthesis protein RibD [Thermodesulfobium narugense DSM 14796]|uniref:Riboflavin biosynthesis protein RibD n=1 Tax=Thermodesulfobium narugense DSM 14796 TaxID=747365 RepID=M1E7V0_9BACT|nr:bifunctional diaminohydroxyphosphoribosylaminopyrimidine deaminase/5-amino-6-(5-phosphoribosylamino)uracil reductase RibD [Thermodesulfobium narugense]AEE14630.1 riboflavin biosynthesis protein RibD [Thermodesulfobium narugense DSM 14796]